MTIILEESQVQDSTAETLAHIKRVNDLLGEAAQELIKRGKKHDASKLKNPEKKYYDEFANTLKDIKYGSKEYEESLKKLQPALDHHYANNSHHPQHYKNGIDGFDLFDLIEYFFDCKASSERNADSDYSKSLEINKKRFNISPQLHSILKNTAERLGYNK